MNQYYNVFNISTTPTEVFLKKKLTNPITRKFIIFFIFLLISFGGFTFLGYSFKVTIWTSLCGIISLCLFFLIIAILLKWNYSADYPSIVKITYGNISIHFRNCFRPNDVIKITSQEQPFLTIDYNTVVPYSIQEYCGQITLHAANVQSFIIFKHIEWAKEDAMKKTMQFVELIVSRSGLFTREKIHVHE